MPKPTPSSLISRQSDRTANDPANTSDARTAQFTLISILLGVILAALLDGLPRGASTFALSVFALDPGICVRVVVVLLVAALLWLEYTWSILARVVIATPAHNLTYFSLAIMASGTALTVADFRAWIAWFTALSWTGVVSGIVNGPMMRAKMPVRIDWNLMPWLERGEFCLYILIAVGAASVTWLEYQQTPWILPAKAQVWCCVGVLIVVVADLAMQAIVFIPGLRRHVRVGDDSVS